MIEGASTQTFKCRIGTDELNKFINEPINIVSLQEFCSIDDYDVLAAIKEWCTHPDKVLAYLCNGVVNRQLLKVKYQSKAITANTIEEQINKVSQNFNLPIEDAQWLVFTGESSTSTYNFTNEHIYILFKNGDVKDISEVDNALINENLTGKVTKYYICYPR